jgi:hypothetical protein
LSSEARKEFDLKSSAEQAEYLKTLPVYKSGSRLYWTQMYGNAKGFLLTVGSAYLATHDVTQAFAIAGLSTVFGLPKMLAGQNVEVSWNKVQWGYTVDSKGDKIESSQRVLLRDLSRKVVSTIIDSSWYYAKTDAVALWTFAASRLGSSLVADFVLNRYVFNSIKRGMVYTDMKSNDLRLENALRRPTPLLDLTEPLWKPALNSGQLALQAMMIGCAAQLVNPTIAAAQPIPTFVNVSRGRGDLAAVLVIPKQLPDIRWGANFDPVRLSSATYKQQYELAESRSRHAFV